jgi:NTP pyrophosphatase (non-canonical NTP hydrolase)
MDFLKRLRAINVERCELCFHPLDEWNILEWAAAASGEAGEMTNVAKKIRRGDPNPERLHEQLGEEIADVIIYLDLLAASQGIDLEEAIRRKFNLGS